jgi:hypothetical protein
MAKLTTMQVFKSISDLKETYHMTLPRPFDWRLLSPCVVGAINGIPTSQGTAVATNGILVAIVQANGLFIGHLDSFVADEQQPEQVVRVATTPKVTKLPKQPKVDISEFV